MGTDVTGTVALGNVYGVYATNGSHNNLIGGPGTGNLISGNSSFGVFLVNSSGNTVQGNYIGTNAVGTTAVGNNAGVLLVGGSNNTIGGTAAGSGNLISGNFAVGVDVEFGNNNTVLGNWIGTDPAGNTAIPNGSGILTNAGNTTIGGTTAAARNIISGNTFNGITLHGVNDLVQGNYIGTDVTGTVALPNNGFGIEVLSFAAGAVIGGTAAGARNIISGNIYNAIVLEGAGTLVQGNYIGADVTGTLALANGAGVWLYSAASNTIGGTAPGAGNLISGNTGHGILIDNGLSTGNVIEGNYIGTDVTGTLALGNGGDGVLVWQGANGNTVGGQATTATNVISGNGRAGVHFNGSGTSNNSVIHNRIGTDVSGTAKIGNNLGVFIDQAATNNVVGGTSASDRNIISGNKRNGVAIGGNGTNGNRVEGNYIGTDWTGTLPLGNPVGVSILRLAKNNIVGGTSLSKTNVISGNTNVGVSIRSNSTTGNLVQWNYIGTDPSGNFPVPNKVGVIVADFASGSLIEGNGIEFNTLEGVIIDNATGNQIRTNVIRDNGLMGIRLFNNGNNLQPFPTLTSIANGGGSITISGNLNAAPTTTYALEFFSNPVCDGSGFGEGRYYIGTQSVTTNGSGFVAFSAGFTPNVPSGYMISSTATSPTGDTSEFSACFLAPLPPAPPPHIPLIPTTPLGAEAQTHFHLPPKPTHVNQRPLDVPQDAPVSSSNERPVRINVRPQLEAGGRTDAINSDTWVSAEDSPECRDPA